MKGGMLRRIVFRTAALLIALVVALVIGEILVRTFKPQESAFTGKGMYVADPDLGHVLKPNFDAEGVRTNSFGFRGREYPLEKPAGNYRIVVLGDSFTFGAVPEESVYPTILEILCAEAHPASPVEVINAGVAGYNTEQELGHLKKFGSRLHPDLVVLGFFIGGDIGENRETQFFDVIDGEIVNPHQRPSAMRRLLMRSHLYRLLHGLRAPELHADSTELAQFLVVEGARIQPFAIHPSKETREAYVATERLIAELHAHMRANGQELCVLLIPDEVQVNPEVFREVCEKFSFKPEHFDLDLANRRLGAFLAAQGIPCVDVLAECREREKQEHVYIPRNTHWNRLGNEIAARALATFVTERHPKLRPTGK